MLRHGIAGLTPFSTAGLMIPLEEIWQSRRHCAATGAH